MSPLDLSGRTLSNQVRLVEPVGQGAYGRVYRAEQLALHRDVAVKVLDPELLATPGYVRRFCREALAASRVRHPNTVSIIDLGRSIDGLLFLVMEFVHGLTLTQLLRAAAPLPVSRALALTGQLLTALEAIHDAGIVHADLKSDNVMVERMARAEVIKVVDFGIAQLSDAAPGPLPLELAMAVAVAPPSSSPSSPSSSLSSTRGPVICGTPGYMAPEVIRGATPTPRCDVYASGVLLYQLLTGTLPWRGVTARAILARQLDGERARPSAVRHELPRWLDAVVGRATERDPDRRYATVGQLRAALADPPLSALPARSGPRSPVCRRVRTEHPVGRSRYRSGRGGRLPAPPDPAQEQ